jgi:hypothetical protein
VLAHDDLRLWSIAEVQAGRIPSEAVSALQPIAAWSNSFLIADHPDLGRDGPVCPFSKAAMDYGLFLFALLNGIDADKDMAAAMYRYGVWYRELSRSVAPGRRKYLTILVALPDIDTTGADPLDELQRNLKDRFVEHGLMIGQFHPVCDRPGLWNADFRPLRSPIPLLAIRTMVRDDLPFLIDNPVHLDAYMARFGSRGTADVA